MGSIVLDPLTLTVDSIVLDPRTKPVNKKNSNNLILCFAEERVSKR